MYLLLSNNNLKLFSIKFKMLKFCFLLFFILFFFISHAKSATSCTEFINETLEDTSFVPINVDLIKEWSIKNICSYSIKLTMSLSTLKIDNEDKSKLSSN